MDLYNLTTPQKNIWNLQKFYEDTAIGNQCGVVFYEENQDVELLNKALNRMICKQAGMRLRFVEEGGEPKQYVQEYSFIEFPVTSFDTQEAFEKYASDFAAKPIGLTDRVMYRFEIVCVGERKGILALLSHMISDAWTFGLIAKEVDSAYKRLTVGEDDNEADAFDYTNYVKAEAEYFHSAKYEKDEAYWHEKYEAKPEPSLIKIVSASVNSINARRIVRKLNPSLVERLNSFCATHPITPAVLFETALVGYLHAINSENRTITIGVPVLGRTNVLEKNTAGMFISTMPLTVNVGADKSISELAHEITCGHRNLFRHQKYPYSMILKNIREKQDFSGNLYDVMISFQNARTDANATTQWFSNGASEVPFVLHIDNRDGEDTYTLNADYQTAVFEQGEVEYLLDRLEYILEQIVGDVQLTLSELDILPSREKQRLLVDYNETGVDYSRDKCVHELFAEQVRKTPEKVALVFEDKQFTYRQVDEMSNSLAHHLREQGITCGDVVPIITKRSWHIIVAMLGVLKAGGAYMPVDPNYPKERVEYMMETAKADYALAYGCDVILGVETLDLDGFDYAYHIMPIANDSKPADLCYVVFTSGSTGKPKGVSVCHRNVVNYCDNNSFNVCSKLIGDNCTSIVSVTNITFDIFVTESLLPLLNGMTIVMANEQETIQQDKLSRLFYKHSIDVMQTTPTKMRSFIADSRNTGYLRSLKAVILGGEAFPADLYGALRNDTDAKIFNIYGPSETTVWSSNAEVIDGHDITIGKPIANTQIYIVDEAMNLLPMGVAGELCIAGDGVGQGYLNRPDLTAERFVKNPFATPENGHGAVVYRTGDLARWRSDGEIEYLGRIDTQVKIRGLRIELGEIESVMSGFSGIRLAAATDKRDESGRQYLVGYYTCDDANCIDDKELRGYLATKLPKYMVPNYFVHLSEMPMTPSGKTDRKNLPLPKFTMQASEYVPPITETEKKIAEIWAEALKAERVGRTDDFFELGGDSLLAISVVLRLQEEFETEISARDIMENSTPERLADVVDRSKRNPERITAQHEDKYVLLPQQKAIYMACCKQPDTLAYNMPAKITLDKDIDREQLKRSVATVLQYHKSLWTRVELEGEEIYGVYDAGCEMEFEEYTSETMHEFVRPFDLAKAPLVHIGFTEDSMLFDMHHMIADGESLNIILRDIRNVYMGGELSVQEIEYADYARYFYAKDFSKHKQFFQDMLKCDFEPLLLPERKKKEAVGGRSKVYSLPEDALSSVREFAKANGLTDTMVHLGAFGIMLSKYTANKEILTSVVLSNRTRKQMQSVVGMFVNTLPVYLPAKGTVTEYFREVRGLLLNLYEYQEFPFFEIAEAVGMQDKSVVNTSFVYQADGEKKLQLGQKVLGTEILYTNTAKFDLSMEVTPTENECNIRMEYNQAKYDEALIDRLVQGYISVLNQLRVENLADISVLSDEEKKTILYEFNHTAVDYPRNKCIHELFVEQVKRTPDKVALVFEEKEFTYRELDEMSDKLAYALKQQGIVAGDRVAALLKRTEYVVFAQLAVLKLGAVFIPVDSRYPKERIEYILSDCKAKALVKNRDNCTRIDKSLDMEDLINLETTEKFCVHVSPSDICYIIYTSGSTGKPKGCSLTHYGLVNFCVNNNILDACNKLEKQICVSVNTISFDFFIAESLLPLLNGYTMILASENESVNRDAFMELVLKHKVNIVQTTPTRHKIYFDETADMSFASQFEIIVSAGESLPIELLRKFNTYSNAKVFNPLGPSECSVWVVGGELCLRTNVLEQDDITIGKPIANTQIYILDDELNLLPLGVAGELCIAGDGVGKGYINRPDLTAERFVENPFATPENGHGKVLYRTGDLACWREDGNIEYLGRIDTQVKIRGLRIELGEIESVMSSFPGIQLAAVTDKRDESGRQYLVGYYTHDGEKDIDDKELRGYLAMKLPKYMVPNYLVPLSVMPMTPSGKTDRKNLPMPEIAVQTAEYVSPVTEIEKTLCLVLESLFDYERISVIDDFFELGGDSLKAIEYVAKAHDKGVEFSLQNVFDYPTVKALGEFLAGGKAVKVHYAEADFATYSELLNRNVIDESFVPRKTSLGNVLLTGATGFLGAHVLDALMKEESGTIYCLVRGGTCNEEESKLHKLLRYYFGETYVSEIGKRIVPIVGDIEQEGLAVDMPKDVQTVIHAAASVKHYGSYEYFRRVNAEGTRNVTAYAKRVGAKLIHISTLSVSGNSLADDFSVYRSTEEKTFSEATFYMDQPLDNVYIHSKFEAERAVLDAMLEGLDAKIIRVGNLTNRASDFKFQPNYKENAFLTRVKAVLEFGMFPDYLMWQYAEFSPIDQTADGVVKIAQYADKQCVFHLNSNRPIYFERMLEVLKLLHVPMSVVDGEAFHSALQSTLKNTNTEYIFEAFQNDMDESGKLLYDSNIRICNDFTLWFLRQVGFEWNETDYEYIRGYVEYFRALGYLEV